jgi:hypothetical protein
MWAVKFSEMGGYDCMTDAFHVFDDRGRIVVVVDLACFGQKHCEPATSEQLIAAGATARLIAAAPQMRNLLEAAVEVLDGDGIVYGVSFHDPLQVMSASRALLVEVDG